MVGASSTGIGPRAIRSASVSPSTISITRARVPWIPRVVRRVDSICVGYVNGSN
jgi:hypothetical protein